MPTFHSGVNHPKFRDLTGLKFDRLRVLHLRPERIRGNRAWLCQCDCGKTTILPTPALTLGKTQSCGCALREAIIRRNMSHGLSHSPEYKVWCGLRTRCFNQNRPEYKNYGGRGITVCDEWKESFEAFIAHVGPRPSPSHSIDRIDNDGNYEPGNVRWATLADQALNKRRNRFVTIDGKPMLAARYAEQNGIPRKIFENRVRRLGWEIERAATLPVIKHANGKTYQDKP